MILMCSVIVENDCVAIGGPNFSTQEECLIDLQRKGLPYVTQKFYDHKAIDYQCERT